MSSIYNYVIYKLCGDVGVALNEKQTLSLDSAPQLSLDPLRYAIMIASSLGTSLKLCACISQIL